jgi:hypothetical protein
MNPMDSGMVHTFTKAITRWKDRGNLLGRECTKEDIVLKMDWNCWLFGFYFFSCGDTGKK